MSAVAIYARYSSDQQRDASIEDQQRICREFARREGWACTADYADAALSGSSLLRRPGIQSLMRDVSAGRFEIVLAESLDRFSRDQEDTAAIFKRLSFAGVRMVTISEGEIDHLHVGLKGTMNALFLKDLADKTRRGLRGRVEAGRSGGGLCYGYRVVSGPEIGGRRVDPDEAAIIVRIFNEFASGRSPKRIAKSLNAERIAGPRGGTWGPSAIHGHAGRGTGVLNNELYIGRLVWNRQRYVKDPSTGRRVSRRNPPDRWVTADVPELRIVPDELWERAKVRQQASARRISTESLVHARRPMYLFSGLTRCGVCGRSYTVYSKHRLACSGARDRGICDNRLTIRRVELEDRVLTCVEERFLKDEDLFAAFCEEFKRSDRRGPTQRQRGGAGGSPRADTFGRADCEADRCNQARCLALAD